MFVSVLVDIVIFETASWAFYTNPNHETNPDILWLFCVADTTRKKRSRWGDAKTDIPGLPTAISAAGVSQTQLDNYAIHLRLEEINRKLRLNDFIPPERERYVCFLCVITL